MRRRPDDAVLEAGLGHAFASRDLLAEALTHVSGGTVHYQRLEFLGDRVLGLAVADLLHRAHPGATEGELSRRLADLVRRETCAQVAVAWNLGPHLRLGPGEEQAGARRNQTILADACEAVIGAVFLDGGYDAARALVERGFGGLMTASPHPSQDPKTALQEWAQGRGLALPAYALMGRSGPDHAPVFRIAARIEGLLDGVGEGASKRAAEQDAARNLLLREGVWTETGPEEAAHG